MSVRSRSSQTRRSHRRPGPSLQGIDPWLYLGDVLDRLMDYQANRVVELTPKSWRLAKCTHTEERAATRAKPTEAVATRATQVFRRRERRRS